MKKHTFLRGNDSFTLLCALCAFAVKKNATVW